MQKMASDFEKTNVITKREKIILGSLQKIIINPDNGRVVGIMLRLPGRRKPMVANTSAIVGFGMNFMMIEDMECISMPDEIIRIKEVLDRDVNIIDSTVVDEDKRNLGKVRDYSINLLEMKLARLYVRKKPFVSPFFKNFIISAENIVKIEKKKITVKSGLVKIGKRMRGKVKTPKVAHTKTVHTIKQR